MNVKNVYRQATNIDLDQQMRICDERAKGYYGEFLLFTKLYEEIPGDYKILMNLNIPTENNKTTEIDLLMIHQTGIYVFEVKHYSGIIYGKDTDKTWTQYFKTRENEYLHNPILQNDYHVKAIKRLFPDIPIKSIVVFTNNECRINVKNENRNVDICTLDNIYETLKYRFLLEKKCYTIEEIEYIFKDLEKYSQMQRNVLMNDVEKPFIDWLQPMISKFELMKNEAEKEKNKWIDKSKELNMIKNIGIIINILIAILCIILSLFTINVIKNNYDNELTTFKQKFMHVDEIGNEYITALNDYVEVTNVSLVDLSNNVVSFKARLTMLNDIFGIALTETSKYIVMTNSGMVYEYDVFGEHLRYYRYSNMIGKGIRSYSDLKNVQFYGVNKNNISYIKITNVELFKLDIGRTVIKKDLELELYKK